MPRRRHVRWLRTTLRTWCPGHQGIDRSGGPCYPGPRATELIDPGPDSRPGVPKCGSWPEIDARLKGRHNGARRDRLKVLAPPQARGAEVRLMRKTRSGQKLVWVKRLNRLGDAQFEVKDRNGRKVTRYFAIVRETSRTFADRTGVKKVR